jgi:hypothetical protein
MELTGEGVSVYAEAKGEYTKQLCQYMLPALQQYFLDMLDDAKQKESTASKVLLMFQQILEGVPEWNVDKVQRETAALSASTHCDYLEELLTAVFIAHTKVLSAIRLTSRQKKLQITIPRLEHFLHRTLTECSRLLWSNTYLFSTTSPSIERQKNLRQIESILHDGIQQAIRGMLPVKNILREYLKEDDAEAEEEDDDEEAVAKEPEVKEPDVKEPEVKELEAKEPVPESKPESKMEAKEPEIIVDVSGAVAPVAIEDAVAFTGIDTVFEEKKEDITDFEPEMEGEEEIKILEGSPEPMDDFEDLEKPTEKAAEKPKEEDNDLQMDFEELA